MRRFSLALPALLACTLAWAGDAVDPTKHQWAKFKPGSWIRYQLVQKFGDTTHTTVTTETLVAVTKDRVSLRRVAVRDGKDLAPEEIHGEIKNWPAGLDSQRTGTEVLSVGAQRIPCTIWTSDTSANGARTCAKVWIADATGIRVKEETAVSTAKMNGTVTGALVKTDVKLMVGNRELSCFVMEGENATAGGAVADRFQTWCSPDVPGFQVRREQDGTTAGVATSSCWELLDFEVK